uniref:Neuropeptide F n=1 Tax=Panagrellus redivivus TaxID=6233 RepID=A0A7E4VIQ8_PANRE
MTVLLVVLSVLVCLTVFASAAPVAEDSALYDESPLSPVNVGLKRHMPAFAEYRSPQDLMRAYLALRRRPQLNFN